MYFNAKKGVQKPKHSKKLLFGCVGLLFAGGMYVMALAVSPAYKLPFEPSNQVASKLKVTPPALNGDTLYIPQIDLEVPIVQGNDESALENGAWQRRPENGDPMTGGNFILSAHRFNLGYTPQHTRAVSPFYHIDKLQKGDTFYVDYDGVRYAYEVQRKYKVPENALEIEDRSDEAKMTLYSCDLRGPEAGRDVIESTPVGTVAWVDGSPKLRQSNL